jgi:hypothetical protein
MLKFSLESIYIFFKTSFPFELSSFFIGPIPSFFILWCPSIWLLAPLIHWGFQGSFTH